MLISDLFLEWLLAVALVGGIVAPLNYRWVSFPKKKKRNLIFYLLHRVCEKKKRYLFVFLMM